MVTYTFTPEELTLVLEALAYRASRHKSEARFYPKSRQHYRQREVSVRAMYAKLVLYQKAESLQ